MRLGYLIPEFPTQTHAFFWREAKALEEVGIEIFFLSTKHPSEICEHDFGKIAEQKTKYLFPPNLFKALFNLSLMPRRLLKAIRYVFELSEASLYERIKLLGIILVGANSEKYCRSKKIEHIHVHSFANSAHLASLCHILGGPSYSLSLHGDLAVYGGDHYSKCKYASFVTAVTRPLCLQIIDSIPGLVPIEVSMGVDVEKFSFISRREKVGLHVVSVARLSHTKGHIYFLEAMAKRVSSGQDIYYTIAGEGPQRSEIEMRVAALNLSDRVKLIGSISEDQVVALLHKSDIFTLNSFGLGEAAPVAVMEAMSTGMSVICSEIGGTGGMINNNIDGILVPQRSSEAIAKALERLDDPSYRRTLGAAARKKAEQDFDYRKKAKILGQRILDL